MRQLSIGAKLVLATIVILIVAGIPIEHLSSRELEQALLAENTPRAAVDAALGRSRQLLFLGMAAAIVVAATVGAATTFFVTRPIRRLTRFALAMSEGDLATRAPTGGSGELSQLAHALNHLTSELSHSIAEVRTERDLLAGILDGMIEGVLVLDREENILLANRALRAMASFGDEAIGRSSIEAFRNARLSEAIKLAAARDEPVEVEVELGRALQRRLLVRISRHKGHAHDLRALALRESSSGGAAAEPGLIAVFHDVTDLRRLETIRTDFVANVSHELRTPITAISTAAETLQLGALSEPKEAAEFVDVIDRHAKRLRQLVDDLLDLSKIEAKGFRLALTSLDVGPTIEHVAGMLSEPARRRNVTLDVRCEADLPPATCDRRALEQVLTNLLDNAIKYAGEGAHVAVTAEAARGQVTIAVADDGPGIPPHHLGRIFERFYRVDAGRSRDLGGTGLGLAIVKHLVELMNGSIDVESVIGRGTKFTVRLACAS